MLRGSLLPACKAAVEIDGLGVSAVSSARGRRGEGEVEGRGAAAAVKVFYVFSQDWFFSVCGANHRSLGAVLFVPVPQILEQIVEVVALSELQVVEEIQEQWRCPSSLTDRVMDIPVQCKLCRKLWRFREW